MRKRNYMKNGQAHSKRNMKNDIKLMWEGEYLGKSNMKRKDRELQKTDGKDAVNNLEKANYNGAEKGEEEMVIVSWNIGPLSLHISSKKHLMLGLWWTCLWYGNFSSNIGTGRINLWNLFAFCKKHVSCDRVVNHMVSVIDRHCLLFSNSRAVLHIICVQLMNLFS